MNYTTNSKKNTKEKGQALVEFALTVPIFLMFVFGIIDLARILAGLAQTIDASRQAVRYGIVDGLEANSYQYLDCEGIRQAALDTPGVNNLSEATINVYYEDSEGNKIADCTTGMTAWDVNHGDVLAVHVEGGIRPVTPYLLAITDNISFSYTSRRTIISEGSPYTEQWPIAPSAPEGFSATVDCNNSFNNVSFSWGAMDPIPTRAVIRNSVTSEVVVELGPDELATNTCNGCASINTYGGFGMYYMVGIYDDGTGEVSGPTSQDATVSCEVAVAASKSTSSSSTSSDGDTLSTMSISGSIFEDKDGDGIYAAQTEKGIAGVTVYVTSGGPNGILGDLDDPSPVVAISDSNGNYVVSGLSVPYGLTGQIFQLDVSETNPTVSSMTQTSSDTIEVQLNSGQSTTGKNFGFMK